MSNVLAIEPFTGRDGVWGLAFFDGEKHFVVRDLAGWGINASNMHSVGADIVCWDVRRCLNLELTKRDDRVLWDLKSLYCGDRTLVDLCRGNPLFERYVELDAKMVAHAKALKTVHLDMSAQRAAPVELVKEWIQKRTEVIHHFFSAGRYSSAPIPGLMYDEYERRWPFIRALREVELNGIRVESAGRLVEGTASKNTVENIQRLARNGFVTTLLNPMGGKTGRLRHEGGFNSLAIPHGAARECIVSRFPSGKIVGFDFNAIDYRCIVQAVGGEMARLYEGARDFHERTASFVFKQVTPRLRDAVKFLSYIYIYGGSEETLSAKTGWTIDQVRQALDLLDRKIAPIKEFRESLWMRAQEDGFIDIPGGRRVYCQDADSSGKVVGLFAQSYSSHVFEEAFIRVHRYLTDTGLKSKVIFSVHDELVIDCHPDELGELPRIAELMESSGQAVKMKVGDNYGSLA